LWNGGTSRYPNRTLGLEKQAVQIAYVLVAKFQKKSCPVFCYGKALERVFFFLEKKKRKKNCQKKGTGVKKRKKKKKEKKKIGGGGAGFGVRRLKCAQSIIKLIKRTRDIWAQKKINKKKIIVAIFCDITLAGLAFMRKLANSKLVAALFQVPFDVMTKKSLKLCQNFILQVLMEVGGICNAQENRDEKFC